MRIAIYSRKSVYTGKGESIQNQVELCRQYVFSHLPGSADAQILLYEDEGFSGKTMNRPQFRQMLADSRREPFDAIVCYRLDRISRSVGDFAPFIEDLMHRGITFLCIREQFDTSNPMGRAMMYIASVFAQLERETIAERVRDNMLLLARTGRWLGGTPPTGFASERVSEVLLDGSVKTACRLRDLPDELRVVDAMYERFLALHSVSGVSRSLWERGVLSRNGRAYSLPGIKQILQNPVYCTADRDAWDYFTACRADVCFSRADCSDQLGLLAYNKRDYQQKHAPRQSVEKWIVAIGRHRGRVSGQQWAQVQRLLEAQRPTGLQPAAMHNDYALLSGRIDCEKCGARLFAKRRGGSAGAFDYLCGDKRRGGMALCASRNLGGQRADDSVRQSLTQAAADARMLCRRLEQLISEVPGRTREGTLATLDARLRQCRAQAELLRCALARGTATPALVGEQRDRLDALEREEAALTAERELLPEAPALDSPGNRTACVLAALRRPDCFPLPEQRVLVGLFAQKIVWDGESLHLFL